MTQRSIGHFTGWHMATILITFFGVVIAVNLVMARYAISTFGGTVVDNSYVASQSYNQWLADAEKQSRLGWKATVSLDPTRRMLVQATKAGLPVTGLTVSGTATHPLGRAPSIPLSFAVSVGGDYLARQSLPKGRWKVALFLKRDADTLKLFESVQ
jgi:nitrogen fixation protein FixH